MRRKPEQTEPVGLRAFLLYAALACLCVSDGVGPRLLPFPSLSFVTEEIGTARTLNSGETDGRQEPPAADAPRAGNKLSKAGDAFKKTPVFAALDFALPPATNSRRTLHRSDSPFILSGLLLRRPGRGPPRFA